MLWCVRGRFEQSLRNRLEPRRRCATLLSSRIDGLAEENGSSIFSSLLLLTESARLPEGVEDVQSAVTRAMDVVNDRKKIASDEASRINADKADKDVEVAIDTILVAHGDVLQILQTGIDRVNPQLHRKLVKHLNPGELRLLLSSSS